MKTIEFIKDEYTKATPILYTYKGCIEASLRDNSINTATDITLTTNTNECSQLTFSVPFTKDRKLDYSSVEKMIYFYGIYFIIKEIEVTDSGSKTMKVTCQEISCALKGITCQPINKINCTAKQIFDAIVTATTFSDIGYIWIGTDVPDTITRHLITDSDDTSCYENLVSLASVFNGTIEFSYDNQGNGYIYLRSQSISTNKFIKKDIDMKTLTITSSSNEIFSSIYATGKTSDDGIVLDIQSVNGGNAILSDFSFYKNMGVPDDIIAKYPQYNQLKTLSDDTYTLADDLLIYAKEELAKYCRPQFTAECTMLDLSIYIDSPIETPKVNMALKVIDKSVNFVFDCQITGVERDYNNPLSTKLTISNIIPYSTSFQSLQHTSDVVSKITTNTNGTVGINTASLTGNIDASLIKTGILNGNNGDFWLNLLDGNFNFLNKLYSNGELINVPTLTEGTSDNQIANTEFVNNALSTKANDTDNTRNTASKTVTGAINELNYRQNVIVGTITTSITVGTGSVTLTISGLGTNPIVVTNGDYSINTAQILGVKNISTDNVTVYYSNAIDGNCKFNYTYKTN